MDLRNTPFPDYLQCCPPYLGIIFLLIYHEIDRWASSTMKGGLTLAVDQVSCDFIYLSLEKLQEWRFSNLSGQPFTVLHLLPPQGPLCIQYEPFKLLSVSVFPCYIVCHF